MVCMVPYYCHQPVWRTRNVPLNENLSFDMLHTMSQSMQRFFRRAVVFHVTLDVLFNLEPSMWYDIKFGSFSVTETLVLTNQNAIMLQAFASIVQFLKQSICLENQKKIYSHYLGSQLSRLRRVKE